VGDIHYNNAPCPMFDPEHHAPITNSISRKMRKLAFESLDIIGCARIGAKNGKASIQSQLQGGVRAIEKSRGVGGEDQIVKINISAGASLKGRIDQQQRHVRLSRPLRGIARALRSRRCQPRPI
jgi:hypothetical protein